MSLAVKSNLFCVRFQVVLPTFHPTAAEVSDWQMLLTGYSLNRCNWAPSDFLELYTFLPRQRWVLCVGYDEEPSGSFRQLQGDTVGGPVFHEILSWGSRRNKSLDCTFSSSLCQTYALRISGAAAQLKNSAKQLRAAETQSPNRAMPHLNTLPAWMLCLRSRKAPVRSTHQCIWSSSSCASMWIPFRCCSGTFFCISQLFFPVVFALPSCIPFFLLWSLKMELNKRGDADARLEAQYSWVRWQDKVRWLFSLLAPGTPPRAAYLRYKSATAELHLQP